MKIIDNAQPKYTQLSIASINENKEFVISKRKNEGFTIAQKIKVMQGSKRLDMFLKYPLYLDDVQALYNLRDALNMAIEKVESDIK